MNFKKIYEGSIKYTKCDWCGKEVPSEDIHIDNGSFGSDKVCPDCWEAYSDDGEDYFQGDVYDYLNESNNNQKYYKFYIEWNTGDPYWDSTPDEEDFYGTIDELKKYLDNDVPADFEEQLLEEYSIYDETGEIWKVSIDRGLSYDECMTAKKEQKAKRKAEEEAREQTKREFKEKYWTSKEEAIEAIQPLINADSFTQAIPTKNHPDRVVHFKNCELRLEEQTSDFYYTHYSIRVSTSPYWIKERILKKAGSDAEIYATWIDQLKRGPKERHEIWSRAGGGGTTVRITKQNINQFIPE